MPRTKGRRHHRRNRTRKGGFLGLFENKPQQPSYSSPAPTTSSTMFGTPSGASTTNWWDSLNIFGKPKQATAAPLSTSYGSPSTSYSSYSSPMVRGGRKRRSRKHKHRRH
jgi:hypothetical protein